MSTLQRMQHIANGVQEGYQRGQQNKLSQISAEAYGAPQPQRQALIQEAIGTDPQYGMALGQQMQGQEDRLAKSAANAAQYLLRAKESGNAQAVQGAYAATIPLWQEFARMKGVDREIPQQFDESMMPMLHEIVAAAGGGMDGGANVQSTYIRQDGMRVAIMRDGSQRELGMAENRQQFLDMGDRFGVGDARAGTIREAGATMQPTAGAPLPSNNAPTQATASNGQIIQLDPDLPPELRAQIAANPDAFEASATSGQPFTPQTVAQPATYQAPRKGLSPQAQAAEARAAIDDARADRTEDRQWRAEQREIASQGMGAIPQGYRMVGGKLVPIPGAPNATSGKPPTEGERAAHGYLERMQAAELELGATVGAGYEPGNLRDYVTAGQGPLLNWAASEKGQKYRQAQEDWVRAKLRKESGAVIGDDEMEREIKVYFAQPGDSQAVIQQKSKSRKQAEQQMRSMAGRAIAGGDQRPSAAKRLRFNPATGDFE